jgi:Flp pilus assembly protein TadG
VRPHIAFALRRYLADERGATGAIVALSIVFLVGMAGLAVDTGYIYNSKLQLQATTDAAALAGATYITENGTTDPVATAQSYDAVAGNKNAAGGFYVKASGVTATLKCLGTLVTDADFPVKGFPGAPSTTCASPAAPTVLYTGANAIQVVEKATVPSFFGKVFGIKDYNVSATATAASKGGVPGPLDVMIVLDTTNSMGQGDSNCGLGGGSTKVQCAMAGIQTLLLALDPQVANVGLMVFPGFTTAGGAQDDWNCSGSTGTITPYYSSPVTTVVTLDTTVPSPSNTYRTSNTATSLSTFNELVKAAGAGGSGCASGIKTPGGDGTYYAAVFSAAAAALAADGQNTAPCTPACAQQAIIFLSDGIAQATSEVQTIAVTTSGSGYNYTPKVTLSANQSSTAEIGGTAGTATATAVMSGTSPNMKVASITINSHGGGYTAVPTVTFSVPGGTKTPTGSGAVAAASLGVPGINECAQAVAAAQAAAAGGTPVGASPVAVYTIAYGSSTDASGGSNSCSDVSPHISPCAALQAMASSINNFYSDGSGGTTCPNATPVASLAAAFKSIASSITSVRLIPDNTT